MFGRQSRDYYLNYSAIESSELMYPGIKAWYNYIFGVDVLVNSWGIVGNTVVVLAFIKSSENQPIILL